MAIPTDDQFFSKTEKGQPDVEFLKNHFYYEGRIKEEHALYIIHKATRLFFVEPTVLTVNIPVTSAIIFLVPLKSLYAYQFLQSAVISKANTCAFLLVEAPLLSFLLTSVIAA
jgi:hypothetical protein